MARDFLREFGPERRLRPTPQGQVDSGPDMDDMRDVLNYAPPSGPIGIVDNAVGLNGRNCGNRGSQESRSVFGDGAGPMASNGQVKVIQGRHD